MPVSVTPADWDRDEETIRAIRHTVFVLEQQVAPGIEWDGKDAACRHALATADGRVVGTGRLQADGKIGRMAVLRQARGHGCGGAILRALMALARDAGLVRVHLHAQTHAQRFYERFGFKVRGQEFDEAGIAHVYMERALAQRN